jgi:hypothetical protein
MLFAAPCGLRRVLPNWELEYLARGAQQQACKKQAAEEQLQH